MSIAARITVLLLFLVLCGIGILRRPGAIPGGISPRPAQLFEPIEQRIALAKSYRFGVPMLPVVMSPGGDEGAPAPVTPHETYEANSAMRIEFGQFHVEDNKAIVQIFLVDRERRVTPAVYHLTAEAGQWRVDSVRFQDRWSQGEHLRGTEL